MTAALKRPTAVVCLSPAAGGMEHSALGVVAGLAGLATRVALVARRNTWLARRAAAAGLEVHPVRMPLNLSAAGVRQLRQLWRAQGIGNVVYLGSSEMPTLFLSLLGRDINLIVRHGTTKRHSKRDWVHQLTWSSVRAHWCNSEHIRRNVEAIFPTRGKTSFVAYTSQSRKFAAIPVARVSGSRPIELLHVGRLEKNKGQRDAVRIVDWLVREGEDVNLTLFGDGPDRAPLEQMIRQRGLGDRVCLRGEVDSPYRHYHAFDAFVFPSRAEGLPNAFLEAAYSGMPCFAYDNTVFPELQGLGLRFSMTPQDDYLAMAQAIRDTVQNMTAAPDWENRRLIERRFSDAAERSVIAQYLV